MVTELKTWLESQIKAKIDSFQLANVPDYPCLKWKKRVWLVTGALTGKVATGNSDGWLESR